MSDTRHAENCVATVVEDQAAVWIGRQEHKSWSASDQKELDAWLEQSLVNSIAYWRIEAAWKRTERLAALRPIAKGPMPAADIVHLKALAKRAAALLAIAALMGGFAFYAMRPTERTYATTFGAREILSLADGSQIELNTDTILRISGEAGQRKVSLDQGEAYFQIKHDPAHPFVVSVGNRRVVDIGTKFSIRKSAQDVEVALTEGSARIESSGQRQEGSITLKPGDVVIATASALSIKRTPLPALENRLGWRRGVLIFSSTTLGDAAAQFNRYARTKLVVTGPAAQLKIDGTFVANDVTGFAAVARHILRLKIRQNEDEIVISR